MGRVIFDITTSLDGFVAGANDSPDLPMGENGMRLFEWYFSANQTSRAPQDIQEEIREQAAQTVGVIVSGRRTYNHAHGWNGEHPLHVPVYVVTHDPPQLDQAFNGAFFTDLDSAIKQAQITAGDKHIALNSPNIARQCLQAGLLDELSLHYVPVLLGKGAPPFEYIGIEPVELEIASVSQAPGVIHLTFRVPK